MNQKSTLSYPSQFLILVGLFGGFLIVSAMITAALGSIMLDMPLINVVTALNDPKYADTSRLLNTIASFLSFVPPSLIFARIIENRAFTWLGFNRLISAKQALLVFIMTIGSMILNGALGELNEMIPISADWYEKARKMEEIYKQAMMAMATMHSFGDFLLALVVIAAAPAIFEELFFRGVLQQIMVGWARNKWAGIIITSILFSAFHYSYFGFLPRVALGIVLGLIFYNSKNLWLSILLHFLNNAIIVTQLYIVSTQGRSIEKTMDESMPAWWGVIALAILVIAFRPFNKESNRLFAASEKTAHSSPENLIS